MIQLETVYFTPDLAQEVTDFLDRTVPAHRRRKVERYFQHVELWLRHTYYNSLSTGPLPLAAYVYFYLLHISLYPKSPTDEPRNYYLRVDVDDLLINRKLKGLGRLTSKQAASRIAAVMKWQEYRFGKNLDPIRSKMKMLYRQARCFIQSNEPTSKDIIHTQEFLQVLSRTCRGLEHWARDIAMVRLLQESGCTTAQLSDTKMSDFTCSSDDAWWFKYGNQMETCLSEDTSSFIQVLAGKFYHLEKYRVKHEYLFSMGDSGVEFKMTSEDIESVLERRYRFALMLMSVGCEAEPHIYLRGADPFPQGFVSEAKVLKKRHTRSLDNQPQLGMDYEAPQHQQAAPSNEDEYFYEDWDEAIRNSAMILAERPISAAGEKDHKGEEPDLKNRGVLIAGVAIDETVWKAWS